MTELHGGRAWAPLHPLCCPGAVMRKMCMRSCLHADIVHHARLHSVNLAFQTAVHAGPEDMNGSVLVKAVWPAVCVEHPTGWSCCYPKAATCQNVQSGRRHLQADATRGDTCGHLGDVPPVAAPACVTMQRLLHRKAGLVLPVYHGWHADAAA